MVLPAVGQLMRRNVLLKGSSHAVEVSRIKIFTLRIVHPCTLVVVFRCLGKRRDPLIKIFSDFGHFPVELSSFGGQTSNHIFVDTKNSLVDLRLNLIQLDDMNEWLYVRPLALMGIIFVVMSQTP